jgi:uncharacterized protein (DUF58 family)
MLSPDLFRRVRNIHIRTRRLVNTMFAGHYHSTFKGRGIEFAEVREYIPGDDVRAIDWNVTARRGQLYIKQYVEERELTVMLLVDLSASGQFGSGQQFKTEVATELCAILALSAIMNHDRVGLILFTDRIEKCIPPQKGKRHVLRVIRDVLSFQPQGRRTNVGLALEYLHRINRRRTISFLISDFLASGYELPLRLAHRRHDIIPISITDRREWSLPRVGFVTLQDLETGATILVDTASAAVRQRYQQRWEAALAQRQQVFQALGIDMIEIRTDEPYIGPLMRFFRARERRR